MNLINLNDLISNIFRLVIHVNQTILGLLNHRVVDRLQIGESNVVR